jgi:cytochrome c-type biogenesis protein CcmH
MLVILAVSVGAQESPAPAADARSVVGPPHDRPITGGALDARTGQIAALLRCPVCQGLSVADSPSPTAVMMKAQVRDLLAQGYDEEQILAYFERSYGEFVRLRPPLRGINWVVWLAPAGALLGGAIVLALALRAPLAATAPGVSVEAASSDVPGPDTLPDDVRLAEYVKKARELAYGRPGRVDMRRAGS